MKRLIFPSGRFALVRAMVFFGVALATSVQAITNGRLDGIAHPYVGFLTTPDFTTACSGSLLSPSVFLTAGHCVNDEEVVLVTAAEDIFSSAAAAFVTGTAHRDPECAGCGDARPHSTAPDVAVITLDQPIFASRYANLPEEGLADTLHQRQPLTVVGYGVQGVDPATKQFLNYFDGKRHRASVTLGTAGTSLASFLKLSARRGRDKGGICYIDSGGPALLEDTVVSINSDVVSPLCTGVTYGYRIDQESVLEFIQSFLP